MLHLAYDMIAWNKNPFEIDRYKFDGNITTNKSILLVYIPLFYIQYRDRRYYNSIIDI